MERTPDAVAVPVEGQYLTYQELNACANQLAHQLRKWGIGPDALVGICLDRSLEMVVALLAIFKSGRAFVLLIPITQPSGFRLCCMTPLSESS